MKIEKSILIVSAFCNPNSDTNDRANNVYDAWIGEKTIITTNFDHSSKTYRQNSKGERLFTQIDVPAYSKNISIKRLYSHVVFALRLKKELKKYRDKIDVVYCSMPTTTSALACYFFSKTNKVKFVIDVIDLWPDSLIVLAPLASILKVIVYPWTFLTRYVYKNADVIIAESKKYLETAKFYNKTAKSHYFYLGTDVAKVESILKEQSKAHISNDKNDELYLCYGGNLGNSYDFDSIFLILVDLKKRGIKYKFYFIGDGVIRKDIEKKIEKYNVPAFITGRLNYDEYLLFLTNCDIAFNFFNKNTKVVHSYKFNDYLSAGLFVVNNLSGETWDMIDDYQLGINYNDNQDEFVSLIISKEKLRVTKANSKKFALNVLNKKVVYEELVKFIK